MWNLGKAQATDGKQTIVTRFCLLKATHYLSVEQTNTKIWTVIWGQKNCITLYK